MSLNLSLLSWVAFILVGRLLVFLWMQFPLPKSLEKKKTIKYLHECDLCSGVWLYGFLSLFLHMDLLQAMGFFYVPLISELVTGGVVSFLVHLLTLGWKARFDVVEL